MDERAVGEVRDVVEHPVGVGAVEERAEEDAVEGVVGTADGVEVGLRRVGRPVDLGRVERDRHLRVAAVLADDGHRGAVGEHQVVGREQALHRVAVAGGVGPDGVAEHRGAPRLVERRPVDDAVAERADDVGGVVGEPAGDVAGAPAAPVLEGLREVPVVERDDRADAGVEQLVDEPVVEREPEGVGGAGAVGLDARPRDREPVGLEPEALHERDVLRHAVVVVARDLAGVAVRDLARGRGEGVPDGLAAAVLLGRALDLVARGGGAEEEALGEGELGGRHAHEPTGRAAPRRRRGPRPWTPARAGRRTTSRPPSAGAGPACGSARGRARGWRGRGWS